MRYLTGAARLLVQPRRQGGWSPQELQRYGLAERAIVGAMHLAHAAATEESDDAVARCADGASVKGPGLQPTAASVIMRRCG